ncbi:MAG: class I SAM-dependent RNA methyltransferase [Bdellovibrionaceae bacterium]|nr:class I SAM-dependent RNA methyltransferase [Pseudobdellovibrionaceae bacterium]
MLKSGDRIELEIDRLSSGGRGVGRHEGLVVFVPGTAPHERVLVQITQLKKTFAEARLLEIKRASSARIRPPCPIAEVCGGCSWQHVDYAEQLRQKTGLVADAIRKFSGRSDVQVQGTIASPMPFHYRNRVQLHFKNGLLGFYRRGSHAIEDLDSCWIADQRINAELGALRARLIREKSPPIRLELTLTPSGTVIESRDARYADELGFGQVNEFVNAQLVTDVLARIPQGAERVFDFYAGAGNFTFPIAEQRRPKNGVTAVELHSKSVSQGRLRAQRSGLTNLRYVESTVEAFLTSVLQGRDTEVRPEFFHDAIVLLDPPRAGCAEETLRALARLAPRKLIYISCDPVTLARDLGQLPTDMFRLLEVQPYDMFPQTDHVETLAVLERVAPTPSP